jgi:hypothetical protein
MTVPEKQATANYVPAAAVIRRWRALSGITGCKEHVGGKASQMLNLEAQPQAASETVFLEYWRGKWNS